MSIIDRILGRTPSEGPQITCAGQDRACRSRADQPIAGDGSLCNRAGRRHGSEGLIRDLRPVRPKSGNRAGGLAQGRAAAQPAVEPQQSRCALRPHRQRAQRRFRGGCARIRAVPRRAATRSRNGARWCSASRCCSSRITPGARDVLERAIARHGENAYLLANLARAYSRAAATTRARRRSSGRRCSSNPTMRLRSTG